ncbi:MAG: GNAT family N-acetyltransferase [Cellvibrionaceae bacterium]
MNYRQEILSLKTDESRIMEYWQALTETCPHHYFQSMGWVKTWVKSLRNYSDNDIDVYGFFLFDDNSPVVGFLFGKNSIRKLKLLPSRLFIFYGVGVSEIDKLTPEYNDVLIKPGVEFSLDKLLASEVLGSFDQYRMHGISDECYQRIEPSFPNYELKGRSVKSYCVDLDVLRKESKPYINVLSKNKRQQVRRSIKAYEESGEVSLEIADSVDVAHTMLIELSKLHEATWSERGKGGAFSNEYFTKFHNDLIQKRFGSGEILLCKISTPEKIIGYLYGFVYKDEFLFYQNGFSYESDNKFKPGFVSHYYLINYFMENNLKTYDFLEGDAGYKQSLSNHSRDMYELTLFKSTVINKLYLMAYTKAKAWAEKRQ